RVLLDRLFPRAEAPRLAPGGTVPESAGLGVLEPLAHRESGATRASERARVQPGLVRVEIRGETGREVAEKVGQPPALAAVVVVKALPFTVPEARADGPHDGLRTLIEPGGADRIDGRPAPRRAEPVPARGQRPGDVR